jgi:hypothetical protein
MTTVPRRGEPSTQQQRHPAQQAEQRQEAGGADQSLRLGYGLDGVIDEGGDGLVYFSVGYRGDTPSSK